MKCIEIHFNGCLNGSITQDGSSATLNALFGEGKSILSTNKMMIRIEADKTWIGRLDSVLAVFQ